MPFEWRTLVILPIDHSFAHTVNIYTPHLRGIAVHFLDMRHGKASALKSIPLNLQEAKPCANTLPLKITEFFESNHLRFVIYFE